MKTYMLITFFVFLKLLIAVAGRKHKKILVNYSQVLYFNTTIL